MKYFIAFIFILFNIVLQAQWVSTDLSFGGNVNCLTVSGTNIFAGADSGVYLLSNLESNWTLAGLKGNAITALYVGGANIYAGTDSGSVCLSTNNGTNWIKTNIGQTNDYVDALLAIGTNIFAGTWNGVYLSTNNGTNWTPVLQGFPNFIVYALAISGINILAATYWGLYLSTDNGTNWIHADDSLNTSTALSLAVIGTNIFAGTTDGGGGGGVFRSTNNGASWIEVNNGLTNDHVWTLSASGTNLFAGTYSSGAFLSTNNGTNWIKIGLNTYVLDFAVCETNIFAAAFGGVYRRPLSELVSVSKEVNVLSQDYTLYQNYPNPWNPSTNIKYSIPKTSQVSIKVYDIIGNEIKTLVNEDKPAGAYELTWNAGNLPSGIYFYRLQAGSFIETKKMILLK